MKGEMIMPGKIDVSNLPEKEVRFIQQLVDLLKEKERTNVKKVSRKTTGKRTKLPTYRLGALHGTVSRREIYDYL
jgi:hypothetical protein